jgi:pectate lyase
MSGDRKAVVLIALLATAGAAARLEPAARDLGREVLGATDGWAAFSPGTTGGAAATDANVFVARNRRELIAALNNGVYPPASSTPSSTPKIIYVVGTIDANVDDDNRPLSCNDYNRNGYTLEAYLQTYDPAVWGMVPPSGPLEQARIASQQAQQARVRIHVYDNLYRLKKTDTYGYSWGVGIESGIYAEKNFFFTDTRSRPTGSSPGSTEPPSSRSRRR